MTARAVDDDGTPVIEIARPAGDVFRRTLLRAGDDVAVAFERLLATHVEERRRRKVRQAFASVRQR
jgi:hypothetical protein